MMKKILFPGASTLALLVAVPALASGSNNSTINQTGNSGSVTVDQNGAGAKSTVNQGGVSSIANVVQAGNGDESQIIQDNGTGSSEHSNEANVNQNGDSYPIYPQKQ